MATIWTVDDDLVQNHTADFTTIQAAINAASPGDTILVSPGIYNEQIIIDKALKLLGAGASIDPVNGGRSKGESIIDSLFSVVIAASNIVFNGFEIRNFRYAINIPSTSFVSPNYIVENINLEYNYMHTNVATVGFNAEPGLLRNLKISNNIIHVDNIDKGAAVAAIWFSSKETEIPIYENIIISNNDIQNKNDGYGIFASTDPSTYLINGCIISCNHFINTNNGANFNIGNISNGQFMNNVVEDVGGSIGIQTGVIYGNTFQNGGNLSLWGDEFGFTRPSRDVFISYNDFTNEIFGLGLRLNSGVLSDTIKVTLNAFHDSGIPPSTSPDYNAGYFIENFGTGTLDATNNWWGSALGTAGNTGELVGSMVTSPWIETYTLEPSMQTQPDCWPLSTFMLSQPGFWIYTVLNQSGPLKLSKPTVFANQTSDLIRLSSNQDLYFPQYEALQTDIATPIIVPTNSVSSTTVKVGDTLTYTITFTNNGTLNADNIAITDTIAAGTSYVGGSITANVPITGKPTTSIQLTNSLVPGQTAVVSFSILITSLPSINNISNTATVNYDYISGVGIPPIAVTANTNATSTLVLEPYRDILFI